MKRWLIHIGIVLIVLIGIGIAVYAEYRSKPLVTCDPENMPRDFDAQVSYVLHSEEVPIPVEVNWDIRFSGDDLHMLLSSSFAPYGESVESIVKDGKVYERQLLDGKWRLEYESTQELTTSELATQLIDSRPANTGIPSEHVLCPIEGEEFRLVKIRIQEDLGSDSPAAALMRTDVKATWEYMTTIEGRIYWSRQIYEATDELPDESPDKISKVEITTDITDVDEPNVIVEPLVL